MDDDEIDIEGDDDMGIGNDRALKTIPHHHVHTPSDSFLSELPETSSWILDSFGDWGVDEDQKSKDIHSMLQEEEYYFHSRHLEPSARHHLSPAKHPHHHNHSHHATDGSPEKSKKKGRSLVFQSHSEDEGSEEGKKGDQGKKARTTWSADEQRLFREAIGKYGKDYRKVQMHVGTRTIGQVRSHAQKYFQKQKHSGLKPISSSPAPSPTPPATPITASTSSTTQPPSASVTSTSATTSTKLSSSSDSARTAVEEVDSERRDTEAGKSEAKDAKASKDKDSCKDKESKSGSSGKHLPSHNTPWTAEEQKAFSEGLGLYGKGNWKVISTHIGSRTPLQVKNHARQYFKKMAKLGVDIEVETKPKVVVPVEKKKKVEVIQPTQPLQALLAVVRPQIIKTEYPPDEDEEIDILGEEGSESPVEPMAIDSSDKKSLQQETITPIPSPVYKPTQPLKDSTTTTSTPALITTPTANQTSTAPSDAATIFKTTESSDPNDSISSHHHQCTKCSHICNNCNNSTNNSNNNNNSTANLNTSNSSNENNDYPDDCDEDGTFEAHIDCPTPTEEKVFDVDNVSPEETVGNREFFSGNTAKTPERYLKIRNTIVDQWLKHKPKYLSKTSVRTSLKDCGDVNAIGRVHDFLERMGAINFGADRPPRHRQPAPIVRTAFPSSSPLPTQTATCNHTCSHHTEGEEVTGPRKRRVRTRTGEWSFEDDIPVTYEHKPGEDGLEYAHRFAAQNAKYFVDEDADSKKRLPRNKRVKYQNQDGDTDEPLPYDPFRLIPCSRTLPPVVATNTTTTPTSHSTSFTLSVQSTALVIMDTHAHMATTEVLGLLGGTYDPRTRHLHIACAVPCESMSSTVQCEMDPQSQVVAREGLEARGFIVVGWYHSHPAFAPCPSIRDIETQSLYQGVCTSPFVGIIVSPYDPRHPSDVSLFNYIVVGDEWSLHHEYQLPYEVPRTIVSDILTPALFKQIAEIVNKYKTYKFRVDMNKMFRRGERTTCLDKMLRSIAAHYFASQGVSADEQQHLINKIRNLFKNEKSDKDKSDKSESAEKSEGEKSEKADSEQVKSASCTTGKRKKDLLQLHQQQQQQRILQQTQQPLVAPALQLPSVPSPSIPSIPSPIPQQQPIQTTTIEKPIKPQLLPLVPQPQVPIKIQQKQQRLQQVTTTIPQSQLNFTPSNQPQPIPNSAPITVIHQPTPAAPQPTTS